MPAWQRQYARYMRLLGWTVTACCFLMAACSQTDPNQWVIVGGWFA